MSDGPRRAEPATGDDPFGGLFREDSQAHTPKYVAEDESPSALSSRPSRALPDDAVLENPAEITAVRGIPVAPDPAIATPSAHAAFQPNRSLWEQPAEPASTEPAVTQAAAPLPANPVADESPAYAADSFIQPDGDDPDDEPSIPRHAEGGRHHPFTRSLIKTAASTVVPGLGMIRSRARGLGVTLTALFFLGLLAVGVWVLRDPVAAAATIVKPTFLKVLAAALVVGGALWVAQIAGTHLITRPRQRTQPQRIVGAISVSVLSFLIAAPLAVAASYSVQQAGLVNTVFQSQDKTKSQTRPSIDTKGNSNDIWAAKPRLNILLVGLDDSSVRNYGNDIVSTDTMMVASIDTATGNMVIIQVPRNMARMQFPAASKLAELYPNGFYDGVSGDNYSFFANAVWSRLPQLHPELFQNTDYPNADGLKLGMEGTLGLKIDYFVALNIDGLVNFINAMGGVRVNVNERLPIATSDANPIPTNYIEPGPNKLLNGYYAMWYARSRHDSTDYDRMGRQTCVIKAVIDQADPGTMLTRYEAISKASEKIIQTDIPQEMLPHMLELARRVKNGKQARVLFEHQKDGFVTYDPDFAMMRSRVQNAIATVGQGKSGAPATTAPPSPTSSAASGGQNTASSPPSSIAAPPSTSNQTTSTGGTDPTSSAPTSSVAPAESLTDACAYNPQPTKTR